MLRMCKTASVHVASSWVLFLFYICAKKKYSVKFKLSININNNNCISIQNKIIINVNVDEYINIV